MSLYDDAAVALIAEGGAGKDDVLYNIKPEEKVKATELLTNGGFDTSDSWNITPDETHITITGGKLVITDAVANEYHRAKSAAALFEIGKTYRVSFEVSDFSRSGTAAKVFVLEDDNPGFITIDRNGQYSGTFTAAGYDHGSGLADTELVFKVVGGNTETVSCKIDNVSVKEVEQAPKDFTFVRGSNLTATRIGPDGKIEKGRENLLLNSNTFSSSDWTKSNVTMTGGQTGYDGSPNAWKMQSNSTSGLLTQSFTSTGGVKTYSFYVKKGSTDGVVIRVDPTDGAPAQIEFYVNLNDGSFMTGSAGAQNAPKIFNKIESVGGGWYRPQITFNEPIDEVKIILASHDANANPIYSTGVVSNGSIFIQNAQLEDGLVATPVMESVGGLTGKGGILEDEPRFDYNNVTCPHLLMEPTRKNLFQHSEHLTGSFNPIRATFEKNNAKSPEGVENAVFIQETSDTNNTHGFQFIDFDIDDGEFYSLSFFVKAKGREKFFCQFSEDTVLKMNVTVDLSGTPSAVDNKAGHTGSEEIINYGDGWYRVEINGKEGLADDATRNINFFFIEDASGTTTTYDGDTTKGLLFYGLQIEKGRYCTSYIPNHGTSSGVTRNQDETHALDLSDYMDGKDITMFVDLAKNPLLNRDSASTGIRFGQRNHNFSAFRFYRPGDNKRTAVYFADRDNDTVPVSHQITTAGRVKVIVRRVESTGEFTIFYAGAQQHQRFNTDYGDFSNLQMKADGQPIYINSIIIFDRALTDDECTSLTTV